MYLNLCLCVGGIKAKAKRLGDNDTVETKGFSTIGLLSGHSFQCVSVILPWVVVLFWLSKTKGIH